MDPFLLDVFTYVFVTDTGTSDYIVHTDSLHIHVHNRPRSERRYAMGVCVLIDGWRD